MAAPATSLPAYIPQPCKMARMEQQTLKALTYTLHDDSGAVLTNLGQLLRAQEHRKRTSNASCQLDVFDHDCDPLTVDGA